MAPREGKSGISPLEGIYSDGMANIDHSTEIAQDGIEASMTPDEIVAYRASLEDARKGPWVSGNKVIAWLRSWGVDDELPPPEPDRP